MRLITQITVFILSYLLSINSSYCFVQKVDGLEYIVRKITDAPIDKDVSKRYELYEIYFENRSDKAFSIPGYSLDLGVAYATLEQINSQFKDNSGKKTAIFNIAAGAASIAFGGLAKTVARTANRLNTFNKKQNKKLYGDDIFLSSNKTYIIYPGESLSLFLFVDKFQGEEPSSIKFICHDEDVNINHIVINNNLDLRDISADNSVDKKENVEIKNEIASPEVQPYK